MRGDLIFNAHFSDLHCRHLFIPESRTALSSLPEASLRNPGQILPWPGVLGIPCGCFLLSFDGIALAPPFHLAAATGHGSCCLPQFRIEPPKGFKVSSRVLQGSKHTTPTSASLTSSLSWLRLARYVGVAGVARFRSQRVRVSLCDAGYCRVGCALTRVVVLSQS